MVCQEWQTIPIGAQGLSKEEADGFLKQAGKAARNLRLPEGSILTQVPDGLRAGQVCGVMTFKGRSVEILPKIDGTNIECRQSLIRMLSVAHELRISDGEMARLQVQKRDILELLIALFSKRLAQNMKSGLQRLYSQHEDELPQLRGALDIRRQLTRRPTAPTRLHCRFDELSENTPLNRLLKATVRRLLGITKRYDTLHTLQIILDGFKAVGESKRPLDERIIHDRSMATYANLIPLARLLLAGNWQNTTSGKVTGTSLLFPMNNLFEAYVGARAKQVLRGDIVRTQHARHHVLQNNLFRTIPDIVVESSNRPAIVDTKWKKLDPTDPVKLGVAQSDVYQMLAYGHVYSAHGATPRLILLYPHHAGLGAVEGIQRAWKITGSNIPLDVATVDISKRRSPERWKSFFDAILHSSESNN
ncbi:5-methylcytosine-specific restriction enzyme subunit McrC [Aliiruegeria haliotis]|uniref:5-methylcytosine-specific restriction enzyme subunit McrC n=2 Tax=Aliiruegeria haliotis TaxID=1280846 RepID=A0A2T0RJI4_9RHOB|nr:5-methylcytosine-specific restriction enzyme subunit McrC [Aliiruegeria haliotis]